MGLHDGIGLAARILHIDIHIQTVDIFVGVQAVFDIFKIFGKIVLEGYNVPLLNLHHGGEHTAHRVVGVDPVVFIYKIGIGIGLGHGFKDGGGIAGVFFNAQGYRRKRILLYIVNIGGNAAGKG